MACPFNLIYPSPRTPHKQRTRATGPAGGPAPIYLIASHHHIANTLKLKDYQTSFKALPRNKRTATLPTIYTPKKIARQNAKPIHSQSPITNYQGRYVKFNSPRTRRMLPKN